MDITKMKKEDFTAVSRLDLDSDWDKLAPDGKLKFSSFIIIPSEHEDKLELHEYSGYGCMKFCLMGEDGEPIGIIGGMTDLISLDGIGGLGYRQFPCIHAWSIDCLPCGYLRVWTRRPLFITSKFVLSNFEPYTEE